MTAIVSDQYNCIIGSRWDGTALPDDEKIFISISVVDDNTSTTPVLVINVDAPYYNDPAPRYDPEATNATSVPSLNFDGLWNYEVVEIFIKGKLDKYIEIEMGPHGHYLILALDGYRHCFKRGIEPLSYEAKIEEKRWSGKLIAPIDILPPSTGIPEAMFSYNAYGIHEGRPSPLSSCVESQNCDTRVYCCAYPPGKAEGEYLVPDFHKLQLFQHLKHPLLVTANKSLASSLWSGRQGLCMDFAASPRFTASVPKEDAAIQDDGSASPTLRE